MKVEIWSDVVCPWCAIGKRRFEKALERFPHREDVEVVWRSFELDPHAPAEIPDLNTHLAAKYRISHEEAQAMHDNVAGIAAGEGLAFRFDAARSGNTFDAHRLLHLAKERGRQGELKQRLLSAYFSEGEPVSEHATLVRLAAEVGLDADEAARALASDDFGDAVRDDEREAQALGIRGVPFFVIDRRFGISGAQPPEAHLEALTRAWSDANPLMIIGGDDEACVDGSCAV